MSTNRTENQTNTKTEDVLKIILIVLLLVVAGGTVYSLFGGCNESFKNTHQRKEASFQLARKEAYHNQLDRRAKETRRAKEAKETRRAKEAKETVEAENSVSGVHRHTDNTQLDVNTRKLAKIAYESQQVKEEMKAIQNKQNRKTRRDKQFREAKLAREASRSVQIKENFGSSELDLDNKQPIQRFSETSNSKFGASCADRSHVLPFSTISDEDGVPGLSYMIYNDVNTIDGCAEYCRDFHLYGCDGFSLEDGQCKIFNKATSEDCELEEDEASSVYLMDNAPSHLFSPEDLLMRNTNLKVIPSNNKDWSDATVDDVLTYPFINTNETVYSALQDGLPDLRQSLAPVLMDFPDNFTRTSRSIVMDGGVAPPDFTLQCDMNGTVKDSACPSPSKDQIKDDILFWETDGQEGTQITRCCGWGGAPKSGMADWEQIQNTKYFNISTWMKDESLGMGSDVAGPVTPTKYNPQGVNWKYITDTSSHSNTNACYTQFGHDNWQERENRLQEDRQGGKAVFKPVTRRQIIERSIGFLALAIPYWTKGGTNSGDDDKMYLAETTDHDDFGKGEHPNRVERCIPMTCASNENDVPKGLVAGPGTEEYPCDSYGVVDGETKCFNCPSTSTTSVCQGYPTNAIGGASYYQSGQNKADPRQQNKVFQISFWDMLPGDYIGIGDNGGSNHSWMFRRWYEPYTVGMTARTGEFWQMGGAGGMANVLRLRIDSDTESMDDNYKRAFRRPLIFFEDENGLPDMARPEPKYATSAPAMAGPGCDLVTEVSKDSSNIRYGNGRSSYGKACGGPCAEHKDTYKDYVNDTEKYNLWEAQELARYEFGGDKYMSYIPYDSTNPIKYTDYKKKLPWGAYCVAPNGGPALNSCQNGLVCLNTYGGDSEKEVGDMRRGRFQCVKDDAPVLPPLKDGFGLVPPPKLSKDDAITNIDEAPDYYNRAISKQVFSL